MNQDALQAIALLRQDPARSWHGIWERLMPLDATKLSPMALQDILRLLEAACDGMRDEDAFVYWPLLNRALGGEPSPFLSSFRSLYFKEEPLGEICETLRNITTQALLPRLNLLEITSVTLEPVACEELLRVVQSLGVRRLHLYPTQLDGWLKPPTSTWPAYQLDELLLADFVGEPEEIGELLRGFALRGLRCHALQLANYESPLSLVREALDTLGPLQRLTLQWSNQSDDSLYEWLDFVVQRSIPALGLDHVYLEGFADACTMPSASLPLTHCCLDQVRCNREDGAALLSLIERSTLQSLSAANIRDFDVLEILRELGPWPALDHLRLGYQGAADIQRDPAFPALRRLESRE